MITNRFILTLFIAALFFSVACDDDAGEEAGERAESQEPQLVIESEEGESGDDGADESSPEQEDQSDESAQAQDEEFSYPDFDLDALDGEGLVRLSEMAQSELCPCEGEVVSLHECMQQGERCEEADELAAALVEAVSESGDQEQAFDRMAESLALADEVHDFDLEDAPVKGNPDAEVVIVEFADFQCPHCRTAAQAMEQVAQRFGDDVAIYFKHFPLGSPTSDLASRAAVAAHQQERFWPMQELLFANQRQINRSAIDGFARQLGLNYERFQQDLQSDRLQAIPLRDRHEGVEAGVSGTPAIFINGRSYRGAFTPQAIGAEVQALLNEG